MNSEAMRHAPCRHFPMSNCVFAIGKWLEKSSTQPDSGLSKHKTSERPTPYQNKTNANFMDGLSILLNDMVNFELGAPS